MSVTPPPGRSGAAAIRRFPAKLPPGGQLFAEGRPVTASRAHLRVPCALRCMRSRWPRLSLGGNMTRGKLHLAAVAAAVLVSAGNSAWGLEITVVSSSPQLVTGGDALLQITGLTRLPSV